MVLRSDLSERVCRMAPELSQNPNYFVNLCVEGCLDAMEASPPFGDEVERFHNHAFAALRRHFLPPDDTCLLARFVCDINNLVKSPEVVNLVRGMVQMGTALCVPGNHDIKFMRAIHGKKVQITHGLDKSLEQFEAYEKRDPAFRSLRRDAADFIDSLVSHYVFDDGKLVVAHAGMKESMQGRGSGKVRDFALYGETTGETDEFGLPVRYVPHDGLRRLGRLSRT